MSDIKEKFARLTQEREDLKTQKIQLETRISVDKPELEKLLEKLKTEYNVQSLEEAISLKDKMEKDISDKISTIEENFARLGV